jgi:hypothetical protein
MANMPGRCSLRLPATSRQPGANPRRSAQRSGKAALRRGNLRAAAGGCHHTWPTKGHRGTDAAVRSWPQFHLGWPES